MGAHELVNATARRAEAVLDLQRPDARVRAQEFAQAAAIRVERNEVCLEKIVGSGYMSCMFGVMLPSLAARVILRFVDHHHRALAHALDR